MKSPALYHLNLNVPWLEIHYWGVTSGSLTWWYPISNKQKLDVRLWSKTHHCQHIPARILRLNPGCSDLINVAGRLGRVISFTRRYLYSRALKDWRKIKMRWTGGSNKDSQLRLMARAGLAGLVSPESTDINKQNIHLLLPHPPPPSLGVTCIKLWEWGIYHGWKWRPYRENVLDFV